MLAILRRSRKRRARPGPRASIAALLAAVTLLAACGGGNESAPGGEGPLDEQVSVSYWLWDENQLAAYRQCASDFSEIEPNISIDIQQFPWQEYWDQLAAGFATGEAPDVFTDHLARYPEFVESGALEPLNPYIARDGVSTEGFFSGLAELWTTPSGDRYGLPKDLDTVAIVADRKRLAEAGVSPERLARATWNPQDGGDFEQIIARLTVDRNGNRGDSPGFDPANVERYGWVGQTLGDAHGQVWFSSLAASTGFEYLDSNPFGTHYKFDDPRFVSTIAWIRRMIEKGYIPPMPFARAAGPDTLFTEGRVASLTDGSWKISTWTNTDEIDPVFVPTPIGPSGRASMFNGLADSINADSKNKEAAWRWVKYLASFECQSAVGETAVVFPALAEATEVARSAHQAMGTDISAFTIHLDEGSTFLFPITGNAKAVNRIMGARIDEVLRGQADPQAIVEANDEVNAALAG